MSKKYGYKIETDFNNLDSPDQGDWVELKIWRCKWGIFEDVVYKDNFTNLIEAIIKLKEIWSGLGFREQPHD